MISQAKVDVQKLINIINLLANYGNLSYNLYGQDHKVSLINVNWQRQIIGQNTYS